jgi:hypothetical protein
LLLKQKEWIFSPLYFQVRSNMSAAKTSNSADWQMHGNIAGGTAKPIQQKVT